VWYNIGTQTEIQCIPNTYILPINISLCDHDDNNILFYTRDDCHESPMTCELWEEHKPSIMKTKQKIKPSRLI